MVPAGQLTGKMKSGEAFYRPLARASSIEWLASLWHTVTELALQPGVSKPMCGLSHHQHQASRADIPLHLDSELCIFFQLCFPSQLYVAKFPGGSS